MSDLILIVDDSLTVRMDLEEAFDEAGFTCHSCADLTSARAFLAQQRPAVVVLDVLLPDGSGVDLLRELRALPDGGDAIVLMLSSEADVKDRLIGLGTGADEYVGKPYDRGYITARTRELLRTRRSPAAQRAPTVLVIDDSLSYREAMREQLQQAGYEVLLAGSGEDGLRIAAAARPDALLIDKQLPGIDGAAVIRRLRLDAALRSTPCILFTAGDERDTELQALDAGADAFVRKQDDPALLLARLAAVLRSAATTVPAEGASELGPKRILAVDDSPTFLAALGDLLRDEGYDVVAAESGQAALDLLALQQVDIILMDLRMPGMDGRETCRRIKAAPMLRDVPLVILTGQEDRASMLDALEIGADDFIQKSADFEVLKARVRAQLRRKQFEDENRRIRLDLLNMEMEAAEARAANELAASRAELLAQLEQKNTALEEAIARIAQANQAKTDFMSTMSHELRTPLNAIIGFSEILKDGLVGQLQPRQVEFSRHIHDSGMHLLALINDILDLAKIEAGKVDIEPEDIELDAMLDDAATLVRERAQARRIRLEVSHAALGSGLRADKRRLKQILLNLLSNAVKFSRDDGTVSLRAHLVDRVRAASGLPGSEPAPGLRTPLPESRFRRFVEFSVEDHGIGMSEGDLEMLFKPFGQIRNDVTREVEGTGLGLVTVARLVDLHGGAVAVTSRVDHGSCFSFWLPWHAGAEVDPPIASPQRSGPADPIGTPVALVVEDDEAGAELMRVQLEAEGFLVRHASSAEVALQMASSFTPALITLDIHLPGMDGWEFLCRIQELPGWTDVPVVVVSLDAAHEVGLSLGAAAVLQKPVRRDDFTRELATLGFKPTDSKALRVLVIDDAVEPEASNMDFNEPGYALMRAFGGRQGIELTRRHLPDLVILDLLVSDMGGIEVVEALKTDVRTADIPVIMLAAKHFSAADRQRLNTHVQALLDRGGLQRGRFLGDVKRAFGRSTRPH